MIGCARIRCRCCVCAGISASPSSPSTSADLSDSVRARRTSRRIQCRPQFAALVFPPAAASRWVLQPGQLGLAARAASAMSIPAAAHRRPAASLELSTFRWWSGSSRTRRPCPDPGGINRWVVVGLAVVLAGQSTRGGHARGGGDTGDRGLRGNARRWSVKCKRFYGMASAGLSRSRAGSHCRDIRRSRVPRWSLACRRTDAGASLSAGRNHLVPRQARFTLGGPFRDAQPWDTPGHWKRGAQASRDYSMPHGLGHPRPVSYRPKRAVASGPRGNEDRNWNDIRRGVARRPRVPRPVVLQGPGARAALQSCRYRVTVGLADKPSRLEQQISRILRHGGLFRAADPWRTR